MSPELGLFVLIGLLALAIIIGVPIGFALFFASVVVVVVDPGIELLIVSIIAMEKLGSFTLLAIPLFMYAAMLLNEYEFTEDIVELSRVLVGPFQIRLSTYQRGSQHVLRRRFRILCGRYCRNRWDSYSSHD